MRKIMKIKWNFSLVELLVVVAIIAILISLLMPALRQAKGVAKRSQCQNNLKNFSIAHSQYISDWNGYAVPHSRKYEWEDLLAIYLGLPKYDGYANPINFPGNIFTCSEQPGGRGWYPSFAINGVMANDIKLISKYRQPSSKFFMVDAWKADCFKNSFIPGQYNISTGNVSIRHTGKTSNMAFIDGHVKSYGCPPISPSAIGWQEDAKWATPGYPIPDGL